MTNPSHDIHLLYQVLRMDHIGQPIVGQKQPIHLTISEILVRKKVSRKLVSI